MESGLFSGFYYLEMFTGHSITQRTEYRINHFDEDVRLNRLEFSRMISRKNAAKRLGMSMKRFQYF